MTKTKRILLEAIADYDNLNVALFNAARRKRQDPEVAAILSHPEDFIQVLQTAILSGELPVGEYRAFTIHDPKKRQIHAAPFADRVAHHALVNLIEAPLDKTLLPSVFACRKGKGVHSAIYYAQQQSRRFPYVLHIDIKHYFQNIRHDVLLERLKRKLRGDGLLLIQAVLRSFAVHQINSQCGLPIGALTSQHFANYYLADADRFVLASPGIKAHCRYMDDFLIFTNEPKALLLFKAEFESYLSRQLGLAIKPAQVQATKTGFTFCGIRIKPYSLKASLRRRRRYRIACNRIEANTNEVDPMAQLQAYDAAKTILLPASEHSFRYRYHHSNGG